MRDFGRLIVLIHQLLSARQRDPEHIEATREKRFRELLAHAYENSPFYRKRLRGLDLARCSLEDLPTLTKAEMMANFDDVVSDRQIHRKDIETFIGEPSNLGKLFRDRYAVCHTSGSQGQPALVVQDLETMMLTFAVQFARGDKIKSRWLPHLNRIFNPARVALITQRPGFYPSASAFSYLPAVIRPFFRLMRLSVFEPAAVNVARLNEFKPHYLIGYTSSLEVLAREEARGNLKLRRTGALQQITNISESLPRTSAEWMEEVFGVHVTDQYGMAECMALSCGCPHFRGNHLNAYLAILEVVDKDYRPVPAGTSGSKILVTNLYNRVQPIIRYEIDDIVTMAAEPCGCGSSFPKIESIEGRSKDKLWIDDGGQIRELPYYIFLAALHHELDLAEHQIVQTGFNRFRLRAAPQPGKTLSPERLRALVYQSVESEGLAHAIDLDVAIVDRIERGPSGKVNRAQNLFRPMPEAVEATGDPALRRAGRA